MVCVDRPFASSSSLSGLCERRSSAFDFDTRCPRLVTIPFGILRQNRSPPKRAMCVCVWTSGVRVARCMAFFVFLLLSPWRCWSFSSDLLVFCYSVSVARSVAEYVENARWICTSDIHRVAPRTQVAIDANDHRVHNQLCKHDTRPPLTMAVATAATWGTG